MSTPFWVCLVLLTVASCHGRPNWPSGDPEPDSGEEELEERVNLHHSFKEVLDASTKALKDVHKYLSQKVTHVAEKNLNTLSRPLSKIIAPIVFMRDRLLGCRNASENSASAFDGYSGTTHRTEVGSGSYGWNSQNPDSSFPHHSEITPFPNSQNPEESQKHSSIPQQSEIVPLPNSQNPEESQEHSSIPQQSDIVPLPNSQNPEESQEHSSIPQQSEIVPLPSSQNPDESQEHSSFPHDSGISDPKETKEHTDIQASTEKNYLEKTDIGLVFTDSPGNGKGLINTGSDFDIRFGEEKGSSLNSSLV